MSSCINFQSTASAKESPRNRDGPKLLRCDLTPLAAACSCSTGTTCLSASIFSDWHSCLYVAADANHCILVKSCLQGRPAERAWWQTGFRFLRLASRRGFARPPEVWCTDTHPARFAGHDAHFFEIPFFHRVETVGSPTAFRNTA